MMSYLKIANWSKGLYMDDSTKTLKLLARGNFCCLLITFAISLEKSTFSKKKFRDTFRYSNSLDPDQAQHFVEPDLGPNCWQRLSAGDTSRQS